MKILISSNTKKYFKTYIDFIDHYWLRYFEKKNYEFYLVPNSLKILPKYLKKKIDLIILPGGNDLYEKFSSSKIRLNIEKKLIKHSLQNNIPLIGICRGMQVVNIYFGGDIKKIPRHMKVSHRIIIKKNFFKKREFKVNSFHNYGITSNSLAKNFEILAEDKDNNIEMFKYKKSKVYGFMWHPEREKNTKNLDFIINKIFKK